MYSPLFAAIVGAPLVTIGLFIFAWTVYPNVHWISAIIGSGIFGAGFGDHIDPEKK